jgi:cysteine-rich repeat protein
VDALADAPIGRDAPAGLDASVDAPGARDAPLDVPAPRPDTPDAGTVRCGDGIIDAPEVCDDGNTGSGDGCRSDCRDVECSGSDRYEDPVTHHCYWRSTSVVSRSSATSTCAGEGGYLIRWGDRTERDAAYAGTLAPRGGRVWIGLQRVGSTWTWDDGTPSSTASGDFRSGEPSGDGTCAEWGPANSLNDIPCSERRDMVCEREPAGTPR